MRKANKIIWVSEEVLTLLKEEKKKRNLKSYDEVLRALLSPQ